LIAFAGFTGLEDPPIPEVPEAIQLFIVYHPFGNKIFGTAPLSFDVWLILIPFSIGLLAAEEMRKAYVRSL